MGRIVARRRGSTDRKDGNSGKAGIAGGRSTDWKQGSWREEY
jgi:hypothetical protein